MSSTIRHTLILRGGGICGSKRGQPRDDELIEVSFPDNQTCSVQAELWGITKPQLKEFSDRVKVAIRDGRITNAVLPGVPPYAQKDFDSPDIGPNMHQVNSGFIKPETERAGTSYALMLNGAAGGVRCELFFSHAWSEGVFELVHRALDAWPDNCEGAYICCLSNPQNGDIGALLGTRLDQSPFYRVLCNQPPPLALVMIANHAVPIHERLRAHRTEARYQVGEDRTSVKH